MSVRSECHAQAATLLTEIKASDAFLPRREPITLWLQALANRTAVSGAQVGPGELEDLAALEKFFRGRQRFQRTS
ncbi:MAG: hypothetical protein C0518_08255 [Opitutus sp.]|nr:hypothetical protein [Opitutus sp.]